MRASPFTLAMVAVPGLARGRAGRDVMPGGVKPEAEAFFHRANASAGNMAKAAGTVNRCDVRR
jgi:hypothetical protein